MGSIQFPELMVILVIAILLFGVGRIGRIGGELGSAVRSFREGLSGERDKDKNDKESTQGQ